VSRCKFDGRSRFATWLTRIAINSALAKLRKKHGSREVPLDEPNPTTETAPSRDIPDSAPNPEETYRQNARKRVLHTAIRGLRPRARKVVEFHQLQEFSGRETAQMLGISTVAAKSRMFHARDELRRVIVLKGVGRSNRANA